MILSVSLNQRGEIFGKKYKIDPGARFYCRLFSAIRNFRFTNVKSWKKLRN